MCYARQLGAQQLITAQYDLVRRQLRKCTSTSMQTRDLVGVGYS